MPKTSCMQAGGCGLVAHDIAGVVICWSAVMTFVFDGPSPIVSAWMIPELFATYTRPSGPTEIAVGTDVENPAPARIPA